MPYSRSFCGSSFSCPCWKSSFAFAMTTVSDILNQYVPLGVTYDESEYTVPLGKFGFKEQVLGAFINELPEDLRTDFDTAVQNLIHLDKLAAAQLASGYPSLAMDRAADVFAKHIAHPVDIVLMAYVTLNYPNWVFRGMTECPGYKWVLIYNDKEFIVSIAKLMRPGAFDWKQFEHAACTPEEFERKFDEAKEMCSRTLLRGNARRVSYQLSKYSFYSKGLILFDFKTCTLFDLYQRDGDPKGVVRGTFQTDPPTRTRPARDGENPLPLSQIQLMIRFLIRMVDRIVREQT